MNMCTSTRYTLEERHPSGNPLPISGKHWRFNVQFNVDVKVRTEILGLTRNSDSFQRDDRDSLFETRQLILNFFKLATLSAVFRFFLQAMLEDGSIVERPHKNGLRRPTDLFQKGLLYSYLRIPHFPSAIPNKLPIFMIYTDPLVARQASLSCPCVLVPS